MRENTPIVIVDLQQRFDPNKKLLDAIKERAGEKKTVVQTKYTPDNQPFAGGVGCDQPIGGTDLLFPEIGTIIEKTGYGLDTDGTKKLKQLIGEAKEVEVCGMELDGSVLAICFQLWDMGIRPIPIFELCGGQENRLEAQSISKHIFGTSHQLI